MIPFLALVGTFYYEILALSKTKNKGSYLSSFIYMGLFAAGGLVTLYQYLHGINIWSINLDIVLAAMMIGSVSVMMATWKIELTKKIHIESSGIVFGMMTVFHAIVEAVVRGMMDTNVIMAVIFMCIAMAITFRIDIRHVLVEMLAYCILVSISRNIEFATVQYFHVSPFAWMVVFSIPALFMFLSRSMSSLRAEPLDIHGKRVMWIFLATPALYHYMIIAVSPTIATLTVAIGCTLASLRNCRSKIRTYGAAVFSMGSVAMVVS